MATPEDGKGSRSATSTQGKLGTFAGVFTPSSMSGDLREPGTSRRRAAKQQAKSDATAAELEELTGKKPGEIGG